MVTICNGSGSRLNPAGALTRKMEEVKSVRTLENVCLVTRHHIPEDCHLLEPQISIKLMQLIDYLLTSTEQ